MTKTHTRKRPMRQDAVRNRHQLLAAARRVFSIEGLDSGVETVAREAGVGMGTLYRHFPSKEDLITALIDDLSGEVLDGARAALGRRDGIGLWDFFQAVGRIQAEHGGLLYRLWVNADPVRLDEIRSLIGELVADAHTHATLAPGISQADIIVLLQGMRGVIEANAGERNGAWERYLELATAAIRLAPRPDPRSAPHPPSRG